MGTDAFASNGGATTGVGPFTHTWLAAHDLHNSLTLQLIEGNIAAGTCQRVKGAKITGIAIRGAGAEIAHVIFDVIGQAYETGQTPTGAISAPTQILALSSHVVVGSAGTAYDGSGDAAADLILRNYEVTLRNGLSEDRDICGSAFVGEPIRGGFSQMRMKFRREFKSMVTLASYLAETDESIVLNFTSGTNVCKIECPSSRVVSEEHGVDDDGIIFQEVEFEAFHDSGIATDVRFIITNSQATITT
jgi:hypothetical protein